MRGSESSTSSHLIAVTRSTSAADVRPARHLATPSSTIVVMPALTAAASSVTESARVPIRLRKSSVSSRIPKTPTRPRYPGPPHRSQPFGFVNDFSALKAGRRIARVGGKIVGGERARHLAAVAELTHEPLRDRGSQGRFKQEV